MLTSTAALVLATLAAPLQQTDTTLTVPAGARLDIEAMGGSIVIETWDQVDRLRVQATHGSRDEVRIRGNGSVVRVSSESRGAGIIDYRITVPAAMGLELSGLYTDITVSGSRGRIDANTVQGRIDVQGGREQVSLRSVNGEVALSGAEGTINVVAVSGSVRIEDVSGDVEAQTVSGSLVLLDLNSSNVDASTVSGRLFFDGAIDPSGRYTFSTHSGPITVAVPPELNATLTVAVVSGSFSSTLGTVAFDPSLRGRRQRFTSGSGAAVLEIESFSGRVRLVGRGEVEP